LTDRCDNNYSTCTSSLVILKSLERFLYLEGGLRLISSLGIESRLKYWPWNMSNFRSSNYLSCIYPYSTCRNLYLLYCICTTVCTTFVYHVDDNILWFSVHQ
jgi:hypothetical protein